MLMDDPRGPSTGELGHRHRIELCRRLLAEGPSALFPADLEAEYLRFHVQRTFELLRLALALAPLLYLGVYAVDALFSQRLQTPTFLALGFGVGIPLSVGLYLLVRTPAQRMLAHRLAPWVNLATSFVIILIGAALTRQQQPFHYEFLVLNLAYTFFLGGLRPHSARLVAGVTILVHIAAAYLAGLPNEQLAYQAFFLTSVTALGVVGTVMRDRTQRRFWLQSVLTTELSISDGLTGLRNHRHFKEQGDSLLRHAARELRPVSLLLIDVDHFKVYNDSQGHLAGDDCLRRISGVIEGTGRRPLDVAARYGGEEFAVLMYDCSDPQAMVRAEALIAGVTGLSIPHPASPLGFVSVSVGVVGGIPVPAASLESYTAAADAALYVAKAGGRNRIERGAIV